MVPPLNQRQLLKNTDQSVGDYFAEKDDQDDAHDGSQIEDF